MGRSGAVQLALDGLGSPEQGRPTPRHARSRSGPWRERLRRGIRAALWLAAGAGCLLAMARMDRFLATDARFALPGSAGEADGRSIRIEGLRYTPRAEVLGVFGPDFGRSVYLMPLAQRRRELLAIDWVGEAAVRRAWPGRIAVRIREREPVAFAPVAGERPDGGRQTLLVDAEGVLLRPPPQGDFALPVLLGLRREQSPAERREGVALMLRLMEEGQPHSAEISEIDVSDPENVVVIQSLEGRAVQLWMGQENFGARLKAFHDYYPQMRRRVSGPDTYDLRVDGQITRIEGHAAARSWQAQAAGGGRTSKSHAR